MLLGGCGKIVPTQPDADAGSGTIGPGLDLAASFEVVATPVFDSGSLDSDLLPGQHTFVLRLNDEGTRTGGIAGSHGTVETSRFDRLSTGTRQLAAPMRLGVVPVTEPDTGCQGEAMIYEGMSLMPLDEDGDGMADRLQGTATGYFERFLGDAIEIVDFEATVEATLDTVRPTLDFAGSKTEHHPLEPVHLIASEPLPGDVALSLRSQSSDQRFALSPVGGAAPAAAHFVTAANIPLSFGDALVLDIPSPVRDMAGNAAVLVPPPGVGTMPALNDFVDDGFESGLEGHLEGDAQIVERIGEKPAIQDLQSLLLGPGGRITVQMPIGTVDDSLSFQYRLLFQTADGGDASGEIVLAIPGGELVRQPLSLTPSLSTELVETFDPMWPYAGPITTFDQELPFADLPERIFISLQVAAPPACSGLVPPLPAVLLDDLHIH